MSQEAAREKATEPPPLPLVRTMKENHAFWTLAKSMKRKAACEPLFHAYARKNRNAGERNLTQFLKMLFLATSPDRNPQAYRTRRSDITHFIIKLNGIDNPVHLLRRDTFDGFLGDLWVVDPGDPADATALQRALNKDIDGMVQRAKQKAGYWTGLFKEGEAQKAVHRTRLDELENVYMKFTANPKYSNVSIDTFHKMLCQWSGKQVVKAPDVELNGQTIDGIKQFEVVVPDYGPVKLLGLLDTKGQVLLVRGVPSRELLAHTVDEMLSSAQKIRSQLTARQDSDAGMRAEHVDRIRMTLIWNHLKRKLDADYAAWRQARKGFDKSRPSFVKHLETLCNAGRGRDIVSDERKTVTLHEVVPNKGGRTVTLLRYRDNERGLCTGMRTLDLRDANEVERKDAIAAAIREMERFETHSRASIRRRLGPCRILAKPPVLHASKEEMTGGRMRIGLEGMLANKHKGEVNLLHGLQDEAALRHWFKPDGSLMPSKSETHGFHGLTRFLQHAPEIRDLLRQLGHHRLADSLLPRVSAKMIARILKERVKDRRSRNSELLDTLGLAGHRQLYYYVHLSTGRLADERRLRFLPDYDQHWEDIRNSLTQLGHAGQASRLPGPRSNAPVDLADKVEDNIDGLQVALQLVREGQLSRTKAAELAGLTHPALLRALADKYGNLRALVSVVHRTEQKPTHGMLERLREARSTLEPRTLQTARDLKLALEGMLANKTTGKKDLLLGLKNEDDLRTWFDHDGSLLSTRSAADIVNLGGYSLMDDEVKDLLLWIGRHDVVRELPPPMSAKAIANALQEKTADPRADLSMIAGKARLPLQLFGGYLDLSRNTVRRDRVARLPDYPEYWQQIRDSLLALGKPEQAKMMRAPTSSASDRLVHQVENNLVALHAAVLALRRGGLSPLQAARQAGMADGHLLHRLSNNGGAIRPLPFIVSRTDGDWSTRALERLRNALQLLSKDRLPSRDGITGRNSLKRKRSISLADPGSVSDAPQDAGSRVMRRAIRGASSSRTSGAAFSRASTNRLSSLIMQRDAELSVLQDRALDTANLLNRTISVPTPKEEVLQLLQELMDEGARGIERHLAVQSAQTAQPTTEERDRVLQIAQLAHQMRRSLALLDWLPVAASPTAPLPPGCVPVPAPDWTGLARQMFTRGTALGDRNLCWFDSLAQLASGQRREGGGDMRAVDRRVEELSSACATLGLHQIGEMANDDSGLLHLLARLLRVQVHILYRGHDGGLSLSPLISVGSPNDRPVYVYNDYFHFEPMWPKWSSASATTVATHHPQQSLATWETPK
ncbi:MAG TPA: hypothetical protein VFP68_18230 [Burkholderiaceae bacterium]|nr:hypothetical protein [Burkholderiaceae bacterium]